MRPITCVVFDFGGVLAAYHPARRTDRFATFGNATADQLSASVFDISTLTRMDIGELSTDSYCRALSDAVGRELSRSAIHEAWMHAFTIDRAMMALAKAIARSLRVALLTNNARLLKDAMLDRCPEIVAAFDPFMLSSDSGSMKPALESFVAAAAKLRSPPHELLLIDDSEANVAGARKAGWAAIRFTGHEALLGELRHDYSLDVASVE